LLRETDGCGHVKLVSGPRVDSCLMIAIATIRQDLRNLGPVD
jgi:hypothetical protein